MNLTFLPLSQPLSDKRPSLACLPTPLQPGEMSDGLRGQAGRIKAWLSLLSPGLEFPFLGEWPASLFFFLEKNFLPRDP